MRNLPKFYSFSNSFCSGLEFVHRADADTDDAKIDATRQLFGGFVDIERALGVVIRVI